jgi:hypothetical protein
MAGPVRIELGEVIGICQIDTPLDHHTARHRLEQRQRDIEVGSQPLSG